MSFTGREEKRNPLELRDSDSQQKLVVKKTRSTTLQMALELLEQEHNRTGDTVESLQEDNIEMRKVISTRDEEIHRLQSALAAEEAKATKNNEMIKSLQQESLIWNETSAAKDEEIIRLQTARKIEMDNHKAVLMNMSSESSTLKERVAELEKTVALAEKKSNFPISRVSRAFDEICGTASQLGQMGKEIERLYSQLEGAVETVYDEKAQFRFETERAEKELSALRSVRPSTLRALFALRRAEAASEPATVDETDSTWTPLSVQDYSLDIELSIFDMGALGDVLKRGEQYNHFYRQIKTSDCLVCRRAKFCMPQISAIRCLKEFPEHNRQFSCCYRSVCKACLVAHVTDCLDNKWWCDLDSDQWLKCPTDGCDSALMIRCEADLILLLERNGCPLFEEYAKKYAFIYSSGE